MTTDHFTDKPHQVKTPTKLKQFTDHFIAFHEQCAFLCEATACMTLDNLAYDATTAAGIRRYCRQVKQQSRALEEEFKQLRELCALGG